MSILNLCSGSQNCHGFKTGFTYLELMTVLTIICILGTIAVPNFTSAKMRAKVALATANLETLRLTLGFYEIDTRKYPPNLGAGVPSGLALGVLTTPIAYLTVLPNDPFLVNPEAQPTQRGAFFYHYANLVAFASGGMDLSAYGILGRRDTVFASVGPDHSCGAEGADLPKQTMYDPSNGAVSIGDILVFGP